MKSGLRIFTNKNSPPVPIGDARYHMRGLSYSLGNGTQDKEAHLRQYGLNGTIHSIVSLLAESTSTPVWRLYKKTPRDMRRRYSTGDVGSDQRVEIIDHPALTLLNNPNSMQTGFEFREGSQQHLELTGETFWVVDNDNALGVPTNMWYVQPHRMEPVTDPNGALTGWIYIGPSGEQVPLKLNEVILEKTPNPEDPYRGMGPVQSIMPNIQQQRYATEYQRNLFLNGAEPGGTIEVPNSLSDQEFDELIDRWRESHRGVARAGQVGVLENGMKWVPSSNTNKDLEYGELRLANRDEMREAWRIHKAMTGTSDDVNRANAQTAEEVFVAWQIIPRLNRRRDTLNNKLLPLFKSMGEGVEFDYDDPSPRNAEAAATELADKASAAQTLINAGFDPDDVLEVVGLPAMDMAAVAPSVVPQVPVASDKPSVSNKITNQAAEDVYQQLAEDFPPAACDWAHHAMWKGPVMVPLDHIDWTPDQMDASSPDRVDHFKKKMKKGKNLKPVILVKTPDTSKLQLIDGHHRYLAAAEMGSPVKAYIATVDSENGPWETMHDSQYAKKAAENTGIDITNSAILLKNMLNNGFTPGGR